MRRDGRCRQCRPLPRMSHSSTCDAALSSLVRLLNARTDSCRVTNSVHAPEDCREAPGIYPDPGPLPRSEPCRRNRRIRPRRSFAQVSRGQTLGLVIARTKDMVVVAPGLTR